MWAEQKDDVTAESPEIRWRLASSFPETLDAIWGAAPQVAHRVSQLTAGKFQISVHPAGELVPPLQVFDAVSSGAVHVGHTASTYYIGKTPAMAFATGLPFGLNARQQNAWLRVGGGRQLVNELLDDFNIISLQGGNTGAQSGGWFKRPVRSMDDLHGMKIRMPGLGGRVMDRMGATIQNISGGEIYMALERGVIDAAEFVAPYDDEKLGFQEVADYYMYPGWHEPGSSLEFYINKQHWSELPDLYKAAFEAATAEANADMLAKYDSHNAAALQRLKESGVQTFIYPRDVLETARSTAFDLYEELSLAEPAFRAIYGPWKRFREETGTWLSLSELDQSLLT